MKKTIRLTEQDIARIVKNVTMEVLSEGMDELDWRTYASAAKGSAAKARKRSSIADTKRNIERAGKFDQATRDAMSKQYPDATGAVKTYPSGRQRIAGYQYDGSGDTLARADAYSNDGIRGGVRVGDGNRHEFADDMEAYDTGRSRYEKGRGWRNDE